MGVMNAAAWLRPVWPAEKQRCGMGLMNAAAGVSLDASCHVSC
jgi:hypothetical protein